jgi:uncharacterized membrane protein
MVPIGFSSLHALFAPPAPAHPGSGKIFHLPTDIRSNVEMLLRWGHFVAGITWIGLLYYFNFINGALMKALDGPTKGKVTPQLMPRALWWFRYGALMTVLAGLFYYIVILHDFRPDTWMLFGRWLLIVIVTYAIIFGIQRPAWGPGKGWLLGAIVVVVVAVMALVMLWTAGYSEFANSNRALSISIGGGIGILMFLNVWGIIWPHQKRLIAWTADNAEKGTAVPAEAAALTRRAFLASRMNTWLSIPMLFFMAAASHYPVFGR